MIKNESEYAEAVSRQKAEKSRLDAHRKELRKRGFSGEELTRLMDPLETFHQQFKEEVESYERLRRGEVSELESLRGLGHALISLRIAKGLTQAELAQSLGVDPSQVSRDERNEYHGITLERAAKVMEAIGVKIRVNFEIEASEPAEV